MMQLWAVTEMCGAGADRRRETVAVFACELCAISTAAREHADEAQVETRAREADFRAPAHFVVCRKDRHDATAIAATLSDDVVSAIFGDRTTSEVLAERGMGHRKAPGLSLQHEHYRLATGEVLFVGDLPAANRWLAAGGGL